MFKFHLPDFPHTNWEDEIPGAEGNDGWYSDDLMPSARVIFFYGTWWDDNQQATYKGKGDIIHDLMAWPKATHFNKKLKGHAGFVKYGAMGFHTLEKTGVFNTNRKIIFLGHSLGAASAVFCSLQYKHVYQKECELITFGLPTALAWPKTRKTIKEQFPKFKNYVVGKDFTRFLWLATFLWGIGAPRNTTVVLKDDKDTSKMKFFQKIVWNFWEVHQPWNIHHLIPPFEDLLK